MPGDGSSLTRLRIAITVFFALDGFVFAGWVVRIPAIKDQTNASAVHPAGRPDQRGGARGGGGGGRGSRGVGDAAGGG